MSKWWQSYQPKTFQRRKHLARKRKKDELVLLAERLEFFMPKASQIFSILEATIYILAWSLFIVLIQINSIATWGGFVTVFVVQLVIIILTVIPSVILIELKRDALKRLSFVQACLQVLSMVTVTSTLAILTVLFFAINFFGIIEMSTQNILLETALHVLSSIGFTIAILVYYLRRYQELKSLQISFEHRLSAQNAHIKARLAPHFFFNTINTLTSLVESDSDKAADLLQHLSHLFRSSFSEPKEDNFEDEIELCEHYISIEKYRLRDKLVVTWDLPDDNLIYDMSITSLTLQNVLEQTVLHVVEMTTGSVYINIKVRWENNVVHIAISAEMPQDMFVVRHNIKSRLNFKIQEDRLQDHFGALASISTSIDDNRVVTIISYPLVDALM